MADLDARYVPNEDEVSAQVIDDEAVIINLSSGVYYSLSGSGALAWSLLAGGGSPAEVADAVSDHYGAARDQVAADVTSLVEQLRGEDLLRIRSEPADDGTAVEDFPTGDYQAPSLEKYSDMADLLALDPPMPGIENIPWRAPEP